MGSMAQWGIWQSLSPCHPKPHFPAFSLGSRRDSGGTLGTLMLLCKHCF